MENHCDFQAKDLCCILYQLATSSLINIVHHISSQGPLLYSLPTSSLINIVHHISSQGPLFYSLPTSSLINIVHHISSQGPLLYSLPTSSLINIVHHISSQGPLFYSLPTSSLINIVHHISSQGPLLYSLPTSSLINIVHHLGVGAERRISNSATGLVCNSKLNPSTSSLNFISSSLGANINRYNPVIHEEDTQNEDNDRSVTNTSSVATLHTLQCRREST